MARAYLPYVRGSGGVGFLMTLPGSAFFAWTIKADCRCWAKVDMPFLAPFQSREQYGQAAAVWLRDTQARRIVVIDAATLFSLPSLGETYETLSGQIEAIEQDGRFERIASEPVSALGATVTIWRRRS